MAHLLSWSLEWPGHWARAGVDDVILVAPVIHPEVLSSSALLSLLCVQCHRLHPVVAVAVVVMVVAMVVAKDELGAMMQLNLSGRQWAVCWCFYQSRTGMWFWAEVYLRAALL